METNKSLHLNLVNGIFIALLVTGLEFQSYQPSVSPNAAAFNYGVVFLSRINDSFISIVYV